MKPPAPPERLYLCVARRRANVPPGPPYVRVLPWSLACELEDLGELILARRILATDLTRA